MVAFLNNAVVNASVPDLTTEEIEAIHNKIALKIYEPIVIPNELVFANNGDIMVAWGGGYAS